MNPKSAYAEKLSNPKWQQKRSDKMRECYWRCQICKDDSEELHVHHKFYRERVDPWEYELYELECLCRTCHSLTHMKWEKITAFAKARGIWRQVVRGDLGLRRIIKLAGLFPDDRVFEGEAMKLVDDATKEIREWRKSVNDRENAMHQRAIDRKNAASISK